MDGGKVLQNDNRAPRVRGPALAYGRPFVPFEKSECETSLPGRFESAAALHTGRMALSCDGREVTYGKLNSLANRVAHALMALRAGREAPVALFLANGPEALAGLLGTLKAGRITVPLDPYHPAERNRTILRESGAGALLTDAASHDAARDLVGDALEIIDIDRLAESLSTSNPGVKVEAGSIAALYFTSGSTGRPKGVALSHRLMLHTCMNFTNTLRVNREDRIAFVLSLAFGGAQSLCFGPLLNGAAACILDFRRAGIPGLAAWLESERITLYYAVPSLFRRLADYLHGAPALPSLRILRLGGEPLPPSDVALYKRLLSDHCILANAYGATECGLDTQYIIDTDTDVSATTVPIGYPCEDVEVLILDESGREAPRGDVGQIAVRSEYLAEGYWRREDLTREKFIVDPAGTKRRIYLTGDLGRVLPDGCVVHMGRADFQAKIRAQRVELGEVEAALSKIEGIREAVAVVREDVPGDQRLVAYVVPGKSRRRTVGELRRALAINLPEYMVPSHFVTLEALPTNPMGKIDRRSLPPPGRTRPALDNDYQAPRTPFEKRLVEIWSDVLGIDEIGVNDNFLELGGHSLLAAQVMARTSTEINVDVTLQVLLERPTVADLAAAVAARLAESAHIDDLEELLSE